MIHVKAYLESKQNVAGVHILVCGFMEPIFSSFFGIWMRTATAFATGAMEARYGGDDV
jgi:hypothetical protein